MSIGVGFCVVIVIDVDIVIMSLCGDLERISEWFISCLNRFKHLIIKYVLSLSISHQPLH